MALLKRVNIRNSLLLLLTATIWGVAFVAQSVGMDYVGPFTFTSVRSLIGALSLLPVVLLTDSTEKKAARARMSDLERSKARRELILGGVLTGLVLFSGASLQQIALKYTTVGKAGFITALYIVLVPIFGLFRGRTVAPLVWAGVALALSGLYFLCITDSFMVGLGDVLLLVGAVLFAVHILVIDHFTNRVDGIRMSMIQCLVCGLIAAIPMFAFETPTVSGLLSAWLPLLYAGALSCGVGYTLQIVAQKGMNPTVASLILSLESVMSVLAGWAILHQQLSARELVGCAMMFAAILLAQMPGRRAKSRGGHA